MVRLLQQILRITGIALAAAMLIVAAICLANPHRPLFYLIDIFSVPILTGFVLVAAALALLRQRWAGGMAGIAVLLMVIAVLPQAAPHQTAPDKSRSPLRLVFANLLIRNTTPEKLLPWVDKQNPDVVALVEADPDSRAALIEGLKATRPYMVRRYDMVVMSRYPLSHFKARPAGFALATVDIAAPDGRITLALAHMTRPWPFKSPADQPRQFDRLASDLDRSLAKRFVMVGDFNTPPLASGMHDFTHRADLHTAPALGGTWPTFLPSLLRVTIDNAMASPDIIFARRRVGGFDGSDHRPICVDIYPAKTPEH